MSNKYRESQIKAAFWTIFHEVGEVWFDYLGDPYENEKVTNDIWEDFLEALEDTKDD